MRRLALAALLALAACSVKTEGAACRLDGESHCPAGQACGYDGKCSKEAAGCGGICRSDTCESNAVRRCEVAPNGICASQAAPAACGNATCVPQGGKAACVALALTAPTNGALVDPLHPSAAVTAELTVDRADFPLPATLDLRADGAAAGSLSQPQTTGSVTSYTGSYAPVGAVEGSVGLTAAFGTIESAARTVDVDTRPPVVTAAAASCATAPCVRDGMVSVTATATDRHAVTATANLSLGNYAGTRAVALAPTATLGEFGGSLSLGLFPFPGFSAPVTARITAVDARGNSATAEVVVAGGEVTRMRSAYDAGATVTSPAIYSDGPAPGNLVFGVDATASQLRAIAANQTLLWQRSLQINATIGGRSVKHAPSVGSQAIFAAGEDSRIYRTDLAGVPSTTRCPLSTNTSAYPLGSLYTPVLRVADSPSQDHAYSAGDTSLLFQCHTDDTNRDFAMASPVHQAGVFAGAGVLMAASNGSATTLYRYGDPDNGAAPSAPLTLALVDDATPTANACTRVSVPLATDAAGFVVVACDNRQLHRIDPAASPLAAGYLGLLPATPTGSPVVLSGGDYLLPLADGSIARVANPATAGSFTLNTFSTVVAGAVPRGLAVAAASATTGAPATVYASAFDGVAGTSSLYAFDTAGALLWSAPLGTSALDFPTIAPPAAPDALPTLLVGSGEGKLFRMVVDAELDATAPWPKAHHDVRNTGNAATPVNGP